MGRLPAANLPRLALPEVVDRVADVRDLVGTMKGLLVGVVTAGLMGCGARSSLSVEGGDVADGRVPAPAEDCSRHSPGALLWSTVVTPSFCSTGQIALESDPLGDAFVELAQSGDTLNQQFSGPYPVELAKVDVRGGMRWTLGVGLVPFNGGGALAADGEGNARVLTPQPLSSSSQPALSKVSNGGLLTVTPALTKNSDGRWLPMAVGTDDELNAIVLGVAHSAVDLGGGLLAAKDGEFFVAKLDDSNAHQWSRVFGGPVLSVDLGVEAGGSMTLAGVLGGDVTFGDMRFSSDGDAVFVASLDPDGRPIFSHLLRSTTSPAVLGVARDAARNSYVALGYSDELDLGGLVLTEAEQGKVLVKYDAAGALQWAKTLGQSATLSLALSVRGEPLLAGTVGHGFDLGDGSIGAEGSLYVAKLDPQGNASWSTYLPGAPDFVPLVARSGCNGVLVAGRFQDVFDTGHGQLHSLPYGWMCWAPALMLFGD